MQTTTHPAVAIREAVDAVTTELVRANIAPDAVFVFGVNQYRNTPGVSLNLSTRADFDSAVTLFGLTAFHTFEGPRGPRIGGDSQFLGYSVSASAPEEDLTD